MDRQQLEVLNVTQQVLRLLATAIAATLEPQAKTTFAQVLVASAGAPGIDPPAARMLDDLAAGMTALADAPPAAS